MADGPFFLVTVGLVSTLLGHTSFWDVFPNSDAGTGHSFSDSLEKLLAHHLSVNRYSIVVAHATAEMNK